jgi:hypothetical protein
MLYDAHIIYSTDSSSGGSRVSPTQKQIRKELQDGNALLNAFPSSNMPSPEEVGQLYQYPYRSLMFLLEFKVKILISDDSLFIQYIVYTFF